MSSPGWVPYEAPQWYPPAFTRRPPPCVTVNLQDLIIQSGARTTETRMTLSGWDGWINGTDTTGGPVPFEAADGGLEGDVYLAGRAITLEGLIIARNSSELWERMEALGAVLTAPRWDWLRVTEQHLGLSRQIRVSRPVKPRITEKSDKLALYTLELQAASAVRVAVDESTVTLRAGEGADVKNAGRLPADLYGVLHGPLTDPMVSTPTASWKWTGTIPTGQTREVDFARGIVRDPATGADSRIRVIGGWPSIAAGTTRLAMSATGTGHGVFSWRSTWP